ncbi:MAG: hypothetical protein FJX76_15480, partial [Armatimonadetes bacterium]|nr:hypothetical protein [Armatimonadota bacterium]
MRPISLTLENFTCFRDLQPTIEFSEMELFAITGPTGAGKSSILDGMVFALFGEVPRLGKQGLSELISLGRSRMVATLDFEVRGERWRIVRKVKRKGQSEVQLDKSEGSAYRVVASSVREVEKQVSRILGLTYDAFVQAVVLPQGEFAKFLKSPGKERRTILKDLLRMQLLDRMQKQATDSARACSVEVSGLDQRLSEDFLNATPEAVTARETLLAQLTAELLVLLEKSAAAAAAAEKARQDRKSTESLEAREARWEILNGEAPRVEADRARLEAARQAATVSPHLDAMRLAERTAGESARALKEAAATEEKLQAALSAALEIARQASAEAEQGPALRERIELLNRVIPIAERLHAHDAKISEMSEKMAALDAQIKARAADHAAAEKIHADAEAQVKKQQAAVAAVAYDAERDALVSPCRDLAVRLRGERAQAAQARAEATAAEKSAEAAREKADALRALAADAEKRRDEARKAHEDAAEVERDGRRQDMAQAVRHELVVGEACPACEIPVKKIPPMPKSAIDLKALDRATKAAAAVARGAEQEAAGAVDVASKAEGVADTALRHAGWAREKADALENSVSALQTQLKAGAGTEDEEMLLAELDALAKAKARHEAAARKCDEAVKARDAAQRKLPEHKTAVELASRDRDQQHSMLEDRRSEREQDARKIAAVTAGEPERERAEAVAQGDRLEKALA